MTATVTLPATATPGLNGDYEGTCAACMRPTDTGLVFRGVPEWAAAGLARLGVPEDQAVAIVLGHCAAAFGCEPGEVPDEPITMTVRACADCASGPGFPVAPLYEGAELPVVRQP
jgi:hypothetical protein